MLQKLLFKKQYLLIGASLVLLVLCYQFAFKKTIEALQINKQLKMQISQSADVSIQPAYLERKNRNLNEILNKFKADTANFRSDVINTISAIAQQEHVRLSAVPLQEPSYRTNMFTIQKLSFEGDFFSMVQMLDKLNETKNIGIIRSVTFQSRKEQRDTANSKKLVLELYLEAVNNN